MQQSSVAVAGVPMGAIRRVGRCHRRERVCPPRVRDELVRLEHNATRGEHVGMHQLALDVNHALLLRASACLER